MNEFLELLKEAFYKAEPFEAHPQQKELQRSVVQFERRVKVVRWMTWLPVTFMGVVLTIVLVSFFRLGDDASTKTLLIHAVLFLFSMLAIGSQKVWMCIMHNHYATMKELKRVQMLLLDRSGVSEGT